MFQGETEWRNKFSEDYIDKHAKQLLNSVLKDGNADKAHEYLATIIADLDAYAAVHTLYLPVDGIEMHIDILKLGEITLINMRGKQLEVFEKDFESRIMQHLTTQEGKEQSLKFWREQALPLLRNKTVAVYTVTAEPTRAKELAEEEWYQIALILRYFIFQAYQKRMHISIGLRGDVRYGVGEAVIVELPYETCQTSRTSKSPRPLEINQEIKDAMENEGVFALVDMLDMRNKTDFSDALLTGVYWVANALIQDDPANEYLSLVSCLETFLTPGRKDIGTIRNAVAVGVSWVLGHNAEDRLSLYQEVGTLYNKRSEITHGGEQREIAKLLPKLRDIVGAFMHEMVKRREEFKKGGKHALHRWIDEGPMRMAQISNQESRELIQVLANSQLYIDEFDMMRCPFCILQVEHRENEAEEYKHDAECPVVHARKWMEMNSGN
jgi:Apea-like HEPN